MNLIGMFFYVNLYTYLTTLIRRTIVKRKVSLIIVTGMILFQTFSAYPLATMASENEDQSKETKKVVASQKVGLQAGSTYESIFPDANLAKAIATAATGSEDVTQAVTQADLDKITTLKATSKGITDLTGINLLTNVTNLDFEGNQITEVSLKGTNVLANLVSLNLKGNALTKVDVQDLPKLTYFACNTGDSAVLAELTLKNLPALKQAGLFEQGGLDIINFPKTRSLTKVTIENLPDMNGGVSLNECGIVTASIKNLAQATSVNVYDNKLTSLVGLENLPELGTIYASKNEITEVDNWKDFPKLQIISINYNRIGVLPANMKTKYPELTVMDVGNQEVTLSEKAVANKLVLDNEIKNFSAVATAKSISNQGNYKDNQITWTAENLKDITKVEYQFNEPVNESTIQGTFSGKVTVPLKKVNLPVITAREEIYYEKNANVSETLFLSNVSARATEGATLTSDYNSVVDFTKGGTYEVTINAKNSAGFEAEPVKVKVHINKALAPVITANPEISYIVFAEVTEADFLASIQAATNNGSVITSDFGTAVKWDEVGDYIVTLKSINEDDVEAKPVQVTVRITKTPTPIVANAIFDIDGVQTTEAIVVEDFITEPVAPTKDGYTFDGWFDAKTGGNKWNFATSKMPAGGITLYAQFSKVITDDPKTEDNTPVVTENNNGLSDPQANTNNKSKDVNKKSQTGKNQATGKHPATGDSQNMLYLLAGLLFVGVSLRIFKKTYSK